MVLLLLLMMVWAYKFKIVAVLLIALLLATEMLMTHEVTFWLNDDCRQMILGVRRRLGSPSQRHQYATNIPYNNPA